jgi:hypothetical protein
MRRAWIVLAALATTVAGIAPLAQAQDQEDKKLGGHIGFVLPLVTRSGSQWINNTADQFSIGFPVGVTFKGGGRLVFDLEFIPFINTARPRQTTLTVHPGLIYNLGHNWGAGARLAFDVNSSSWGFTPLVNHSWPIKGEHSFFKAYFLEGDFPVRFNRTVGVPATDPVTFALHFGLAF